MYIYNVNIHMYVIYIYMYSKFYGIKCLPKQHFLFDEARIFGLSVVSGSGEVALGSQNTGIDQQV